MTKRNKRILRSAICILLFSLFIVPIAVQTSSKGASVLTNACYIVNSSSGVQLKASRSDASATLATIPNGTYIYVLTNKDARRDGVWGYTAYDGKYGYIRLSSATRNAGEPETTGEVAKRLAAVQSFWPNSATWKGSRDNNASVGAYESNTGSWNGERECFAFAEEVWRALWGSEMANKIYATSPYMLGTNDSVMKKVGTITPSNYNISAMQALLTKARPGDIIQMGYRDSYGTHPHTCVVQSVSVSGITIYDANAGNSSNRVRSVFMTWYDFYSERNKYGMTLYTYPNYPPEKLAPIEGGAIIIKGTNGAVSTNFYLKDKVTFSADIRNAKEVTYYVAEASTGAVVAQGNSALTFTYTFDSLYNNSSSYYVYYTASNAEHSITSERKYFTVSNPTVSISGGTLSVATGKTATLNVSYAPSGARIVWTSSNTAVATVSGDGIVMAKTAGTATITATLMYTGTGGQIATASASIIVTTYNPVYTVTFNPNGGSTPVASKSVTNTLQYGDLPTPTRVGYTFAGWYTASVGGTKIVSTSVVSLSGNSVLYAQWTPNKYTIAFDPNGGSTPIASITVQYASVYGSMPVPVRPGYNFDGWYTAAVGGSKITSSTQVTVAANQSLYAHWSPASFKLTFNTTGGSASVLSKIVTYTSTYGELPAATRIGYTFDGWYTEAVGGTAVKAGDTVLITSDTTVYAHWTANKYKTTFDPAGGSKTEEDRVVTFGTEYGALPVPVRPGYSFQGWYTESGERVINTTVVSIASDHKLIAHWDLGRFTVTFVTNGSGSITPVESKHVTYLTTYGELPVPTRVGYTFVGWYTDPNEGERIVDTTPVSIVENQSLYAHWSVNTYTVSFNSGKSDDVFESIRVVFDTAYGELPVPKRLGYTFSGWYTAETGGELINEKSILKIGEDSTLYARWTPNKYRIYLDGNTGTVSVKYVSLDYELPYGELPIPTKKGYLFTGWYTSLNNGVLITPDSIVSNAFDITLYATWTAKSINFSFDPNGGVTDGKDITVLFDGKYGELPSASRVGYNFIGWKNANGDMVREDSIVDVDIDSALTAVWEAIKYDVKLVLDGGKFASDDEKSSFTVAYDSPYPNMPTPLKEGYRFIGWKTSGNDIVYSGDLVKIIESQSFVAQWTPDVYSVAFDAAGGTVDIESIKVYYDSVFGVLATALRTGYSFAGWYDASGKLVTEETIVKITESIILTAKWEPNTYIVKLNSKGGTLDGKNEIILKYGDKYGELPVPVMNGYKFLYWKDPENRIISEYDVVNLLENTVFTAEWVAIDYEITFKTGDEKIVIPPKMVKYDGEYGELPEISRTGYIFNGWFIGEEEIKPEMIVKYAENMVLEANWTPILYYVNFVGNGGTCSVDKKGYTCDETYGIMPFATRPGYNFAGWYDADGIQITENMAVRPVDGLTFTAKWEKVAYNVYFRVDNKIDTRYTMSVFYGDSYGKLPDFVTPGYAFMYWADVNGKRVNNTDVYNYVTDITLYAVVTPNIYDVTFYAEGGEPEYSNKAVSYNSSFGKLPTAIKRGYVFDGWYTKGGEPVTEGTIFSYTEDIMLYAHWIELVGNTAEMFGGNTMLVTGCEVIAGVNILLLIFTGLTKRKRKKDRK